MELLINLFIFTKGYFYSDTRSSSWQFYYYRKKRYEYEMTMIDHSGLVRPTVYTLYCVPLDHTVSERAPSNRP